MPGTLSCKDCGSTTRKLSRPGPRCATCKRKRKNDAREAAWERSLLSKYGITTAQYWALYDAQGGCCYICTHATGRSRRLSVDHDHSSGYVRGLLCRPCNTLVGRFRDDPEAFDRGGDYLRHPPATDVIGLVKADD